VKNAEPAAVIAPLHHPLKELKRGLRREESS